MNFTSKDYGRRFCQRKSVRFSLFLFFALLLVSITPLSYTQTNTSGLIGQNLWMTSYHNSGVLQQAYDQVRDIKLELVRLGGHGFNDSYLGTAAYDDLLDDVESLGATPSLQIGHYWNYSDCEDLLIHLANSGRNITYFSVGNEPDNKEGWSVFNVQDYIDKFISRAKLIRQYYPDAIISGGSFADVWYKDGENPIDRNIIPFFEGTRYEKDNNGKYLLNVFDFHNYTDIYSSADVITYDVSAFKNRWETYVKSNINIANQSRPADEQLSWSLSEFHTTYNNDLMNVGGVNFAPPSEGKTYSFYAGQYFAMMYGFGLENGASAMMPWSLHESSGSRVDVDLGIFDGSGPFTPRSTYYHTQMLAQNLKDNWVSNSSTQERVEVVSVSDGTGTTVLVINTGGAGYNMTLKLDMGAASGNDLVIKVDAGKDKEITDYIGGQTTQTYVFDASGNLTKIVTYTKSNADNKQAPSEEIIPVGPTDPIAIPGKVQAQDWSDQYGLELETTADVDGDQNFGWTTAGDWAEYTVDIASAGTYTVDYRVAILNGGASFDLVVNNNVVNSVAVASTGGWQEWITISDEVTLPAGEQTIRLNITAAGFNLNWFELQAAVQVPELTSIEIASGPASIEVGEQYDYYAEGYDQFGNTISFTRNWNVSSGGTIDGNGIFTATTAGGPYTITCSNGSISDATTISVTEPVVSIAIPGKVQAQEWSDQYGLELETTADVDGDQNFGWTTAGDWAEYTVNIASAGNYTVDYRVASLNGGAGFDMMVNNNVVNSVTVASTGGWQEWVTLSDEVTLPAGEQTIRINITGAGFNLNWFELRTAQPTPELTSINILDDNQTLEIGDTYDYTAYGYDQFGDIFEFTRNWYVSNGGVINASSGVFTATAAGTFTITCYSGSVSTSTNVLVNELPTGAAIPGIVQAEEFDDMFGLIATATTVGYVDAGDWLEYNVDIATTGTYKMEFYVASAIATGSCEVSIDGGASLGTFNAPNTGGWAAFELASIEVDLPAGTHTLSLNFTAAAFNIDYIEFSEVTDNPTINSVAFDPIAVVESGETYSIDVNYSSLTTNEVQVAFFANGWIWLSGTTVTVGAGTGVVSIDVAIPAATAVGADYIWQTEIHPVGGTWEDRYDVADLTNVQVVNLKNANSGDAITQNRDELKLYPMPVNDFVNIAGLDSFNKLEVFNSVGQLIISETLYGESEYRLNLNGFDNGIYIMQISNDFELKSEKIIKQ